MIAAMPRDRAAHLIDHMTPGQAADVLAVLPWSHANAIMRLLHKEKARKSGIFWRHKMNGSSTMSARIA